MNWELSGSQDPTRAAVWITASQPSQALMKARASWISQLAISTSGGSSLVTLFARTVTRTVWLECTNAEHNLPPKKPVTPINNTLISVFVWTPCVSESEGERENRERIPATPLTRRKTEHSTLKPVPWSDWGQVADQNLDRHGGFQRPTSDIHIPATMTTPTLISPSREEEALAKSLAWEKSLSFSSSSPWPEPFAGLSYLAAVIVGTDVRKQMQRYMVNNVIWKAKFHLRLCRPQTLEVTTAQPEAHCC